MTLSEFFEKWRDGPMDTAVNRSLMADLEVLLAVERKKCIDAARYAITRGPFDKEGAMCAVELANEVERMILDYKS